LNQANANVPLLWQLALNGFVPLAADEQTAETLSRVNVAGFVTSQGRVIGLPDKVWGDYECGLIPASRVVQMMILRVLLTKGLEPPIAS